MNRRRIKRRKTMRKKKRWRPIMVFKTTTVLLLPQVLFIPVFIYSLEVINLIKYLLFSFPKWHLFFMLCFRSEVSVEEGLVHSSPSPVPTRACPQWQACSFLRSWSVCQNHQRARLPPLSQTTAGYKHTLLFCHALTFCPVLSPTLYSLRSPSSPTLFSSIQIRMRVKVTSVPVPVCLPLHLTAFIQRCRESDECQF